MELVLILMELYSEDWMNLIVGARLSSEDDEVYLKLEHPIVAHTDVEINQLIKIDSEMITKAYGQILYPRGTFNSFDIEGPIEKTLLATGSKSFRRPTNAQLWSPIVCKYEIEQTWKRPVELIIEADCLTLNSSFVSSSMRMKIELFFSQLPSTITVEPNNLSQYITYTDDTVVWHIESHCTALAYKLSFKEAKLTKIASVYDISGKLKDSFTGNNINLFSIKIDSKAVDLARVSYATRVEETLAIGQH